MPLHLTWPDLALRLFLTLLAGFLIGINRNERGKPAGLRTTMLVTLASSLALLLANSLIDTTGKVADSFVQLDMMRLPLGVLTGMGFIGAGTILRKGNLVVGVTTAATLWFCTLLGFCFGAGQNALGITALAIALFILWVVKWGEDRLKQDQRASLIIETHSDALTEEEIRTTLLAARLRIDNWGVSYLLQPEKRRTIRCVVEWRAIPGANAVPPVIATLRDNPAVVGLEWLPAGAREG